MPIACVNVWAATWSLAVDMRREKTTTRRLTLAAVAAVLGVILLALGSLVQVLDLTMAVLASLLVVLGVIELGGKYPYLIYAVTAILSVLFVTPKTAPLVYLLFAGYYPILKAKLERHFSRPVCWVIKTAIFNIALFACAFVLFKFFTSEIPPEWIPYWWALFFLTPVFWLYDVALTRLISAYLFRWRERLRFFK